MWNSSENGISDNDGTMNRTIMQIVKPNSRDMRSGVPDG